MTAWWLSWYHDTDHGEFELHTPWWISGYRFTPRADTIVAAVPADSEEAAWEVVRTAYDTPPEKIEQRFIHELLDDENHPNIREPWTDKDGRFPRADWMTWPGVS
jgi:hypothetical protein